MTRRARHRAIGTVTLAMSLLGSLAPACGKKQPAVHVGGILGFNQRYAASVDGPFPRADPAQSCGSKTATFGTELLDTPVAKAKVLREWGPVSGRETMFISGTIANIELSTGDLIFDHPWNVDFALDLKPDPPFRDLAQTVGRGAREGGPSGTIHMELEQGLMPHSDTTNLGHFMPGFLPRVGDRLAAWGPWILDCGHADNVDGLVCRECGAL